jgi:hypothetical protein
MTERTYTLPCTAGICDVPTFFSFFFAGSVKQKPVHSIYLLHPSTQICRIRCFHDGSAIQTDLSGIFKKNFISHRGFLLVDQRKQITSTCFLLPDASFFGELHLYFVFGFVFVCVFVLVFVLCLVSCFIRLLCWVMFLLSPSLRHLS